MATVAQSGTPIASSFRVQPAIGDTRGLASQQHQAIGSRGYDSFYLNKDNITVAVGAGTSAGTFYDTFDDGATIEKVIDAPTAYAEEFHNQQTHIWFTADAAGGGLELKFDFGSEYAVNTLHFWNYTAENYDLDSVAF